MTAILATTSPGKSERAKTKTATATTHLGVQGTTGADEQRIIESAIFVLSQGELLLSIMTPELFTRKNPIAFNGSIGGHYRHCLDHFSCVLNGVKATEINYDHRERNVAMETKPDVALKITRQLKKQLQELRPEILNTTTTACCEVSYEHGNSPRTKTTNGRELVYAIAHAIHHYALISVIARLMEIKLPEHFGIAPSTVNHLAATNSTSR